MDTEVTDLTLTLDSLLEGIEPLGPPPAITLPPITQPPDTNKLTFMGKMSPEQRRVYWRAMKAREREKAKATKLARRANPGLELIEALQKEAAWQHDLNEALPRISDPALATLAARVMTEMKARKAAKQPVKESE